MTVTSETNRVSYSGDDSTVDFAVPFYFLLDTSISVTLVDSDDAETTWVLDTDYTVTDAGVLTGGEITAATAPATGETLVIIRSEALTQTTDYIENDDFPAASHERALDKAMMINQQQQEEIARCITAPVGDDGTTDYTLPIYEASSFLQWHPTSKELRNAELAATGTATIGTDTGDLVELVEVSSGVAGWPALALDNMTYSGVAVGDATTKDVGSTSGTLAELASGGVFPLARFGLDEDDFASDSATLAPSQQSVKAYIGTAGVEDTGTTSGTIPLIGAGDVLSASILPTAGKINLATPQASTSGTYIDFTGIPAGTKQITVSLSKVSTNGSSNFLIQIGDAGGVEATGYITGYGGSASVLSTDGFIVNNISGALYETSGSLVLTLVDASTFTWSGMGSFIQNGGGDSTCAGDKSLSAELDKIRITMVNGTDAFDAGKVNIAYQ